MTTHPTRLPALTLGQLAQTMGGNNGRIVTDPDRCTVDNPRGARIWHQSVHSYPR